MVDAVRLMKCACGRWIPEVVALGSDGTCVHTHRMKDGAKETKHSE